MSLVLLMEQAINGLQLGVMLFMMAAGLTLVFGILNVVNLAHGSVYMVGAFVAASALARTGSFPIAVLAGVVGAAVTGLVLERVVLRRLYDRDHLDQVLATFGLLLFFNELVRVIWGSTPLYTDIPGMLAGFVPLPAGGNYPVYRLLLAALGLLVAGGLFVLIAYTRFGILVRAGASNREMIGALGVNIGRLFAIVFTLGAALAGFAGALVGPLLTVEVGMGEPVLIVAFVIVVIGGIGSVRGAFAGALLVGMVDTMGRAFLPRALGYTIGPAVSSMSVYLLMALMLWLRPRGLFPAPTAISDQPAASHATELDPPESRLLRRIVIGVALALLIAIPILNEPFYTRLFTRVLILGLAALSLDLIFGFGGMVSFGHAAFVGIGAYIVGIAAQHGTTDLLFVWPLAILAASLAAFVIGAIALRTSGIYFIMITLAFGQMLYFVGVSLEAYGGDNGLPLKAHSTIGTWLTLADPRALYAVSLLMVVGFLWAAGRFVRSEFGMALRAIRDNERRMRAIGFPTFRYRLAAFTLSGGIAGLAGALLVNVDSYVGPSSLHWFVSGELMIMVILGGAATLFGPVAGAALFVLLKEGLSGMTQHWMLIFGPLLVLAVLFTKGGFYGWLSARRSKHA